jgi:endonuclease/exonuclease/phosphatase family metal-dependent hydrolase
LLFSISSLGESDFALSLHGGSLIKVLTYNVWGLPEFLAPFRKQRIQTIREKLNQQHWDFVLIQEAWLKDDRKLLRDCGYSYIVDLDGPGQGIDSGLLILSRHPVIESSQSRLRYKKNGRLGSCFRDGEYFAKKSLIAAKFLHPVMGPIWVANTHLVAAGGNPDTYAEQRTHQVEELLGFVSPKAAELPFILGGDFNCGPGTKVWSHLTKGLTHFIPHEEISRPDKFNTYYPEGAPRATQLDHLFLSRHFEHVESRLRFEDYFRIGGQYLRPSDHLGWEMQVRPTDLQEWAEETSFAGA